MENSDTVARARALLALILTPNEAESLVDGLRAVSGPITMLKLHIAAGASRVALPDGAMTGFYVFDDHGSRTGELLLWIEDVSPLCLSSLVHRRSAGRAS